MRVTTNVPLQPTGSIGVRHHLTFHKYSPQLQPNVSSEPQDEEVRRAYIQASLHADELPGLLVSHHLIRLLDAAAKEGRIAQEIVIVPYANPIGLSQNLFGYPIGRFSLSTGTNFNRGWIDIGKTVIQQVKDNSSDQLDNANAQKNVRLLREAMISEIDKLADDPSQYQLQTTMKRELFKVACTSDIVLDLHCDNDAIMHMYTHDRLWPELSDLANELGSRCNILAPNSGGNCFDEACSCPWAEFAIAFPTKNIPMACQSATVELRGLSDVSDELAQADACALFRFLQNRGYIREGQVGDSNAGSPLRGAGMKRGREETGTSTDGTSSSTPTPSAPLTGVDMMHAIAAGVLTWKVAVGDMVKKGDLLGEIVNIEDVDAPRVPIVARIDGVVFARKRHNLAIPGEICIKVSSPEPLPWRTGCNQLLTE